MYILRLNEKPTKEEIEDIVMGIRRKTGLFTDETGKLVDPKLEILVFGYKGEIDVNPDKPITVMGILNNYGKILYEDDGYLFVDVNKTHLEIKPPLGFPKKVDRDICIAPSDKKYWNSFYLGDECSIKSIVERSGNTIIYRKMVGAVSTIRTNGTECVA
jgi:hypothetical protein